MFGINWNFGLDVQEVELCLWLKFGVSYSIQRVAIKLYREAEA